MEPPRVTIGRETAESLSSRPKSTSAPLLTKLLKILIESKANQKLKFKEDSWNRLALPLCLHRLELDLIPGSHETTKLRFLRRFKK